MFWSTMNWDKMSPEDDTQHKSHHNILMEQNLSSGRQLIVEFIPRSSNTVALSTRPNKNASPVCQYLMIRE